QDLARSGLNSCFNASSREPAFLEEFLGLGMAGSARKPQREWALAGQNREEYMAYLYLAVTKPPLLLSCHANNVHAGRGKRQWLQLAAIERIDEAIAIFLFQVVEQVGSVRSYYTKEFRICMYQGMKHVFGCDVVCLVFNSSV